MAENYLPPSMAFLNGLMSGDWTGIPRYGVTVSEKERLAREGSLPGAPKDNTAEQEVADRYASGYLFGKTHPSFSKAIMPFVNLIKTSDLPLLGGSTPELQSWANYGVARGSEEE